MVWKNVKEIRKLNLRLIKIEKISILVNSNKNSIHVCELMDMFKPIIFDGKMNLC